MLQRADVDDLERGIGSFEPYPDDEIMFHQNDELVRIAAISENVVDEKSGSVGYREKRFVDNIAVDLRSIDRPFFQHLQTRHELEAHSHPKASS